MGHWKSVAIFSWSARADGPTAREVVAFGNQLMSSSRRISLIHVVEETAGLPTTEGREALLGAARVHQERMACIGVLLPEAHVFAAMMRVFVRGAGVIVRNQAETIVAPTLPLLVRQVLEAHRRRTGEQLDARELAAAIEAVRGLVRTPS